MSSSFSTCQVPSFSLGSSNANHHACWSYFWFPKPCSWDYVWNPSFVLSGFSIWHDAQSFYVRFYFGIVKMFFKYMATFLCLPCLPGFAQWFCILLFSLFVIHCDLTLNFTRTQPTSSFLTILLQCIFYCSRWLDIIHFSWVDEQIDLLLIYCSSRFTSWKITSCSVFPHCSFIRRKEVF